MYFSRLHNVYVWDPGAWRSEWRGGFCWYLSSTHSQKKWEYINIGKKRKLRNTEKLGIPKKWEYKKGADTGGTCAREVCRQSVGMCSWLLQSNIIIIHHHHKKCVPDYCSATSLSYKVSPDNCKGTLPSWTMWPYLLYKHTWVQRMCQLMCPWLLLGKIIIIITFKKDVLWKLPIRCIAETTFITIAIFVVQHPHLRRSS